MRQKSGRSRLSLACSALFFSSCYRWLFGKTPELELFILPAAHGVKELLQIDDSPFGPETACQAR
jgi:hypothetical protein